MSHIIMIEEPNGNNMLNIKLSSNASLPISISNDDLSQSQSASEYTDADESISAPTEYLAEFMSAVMLRDYRKALIYCKLILQFEPNNMTAKDFYPLIEEKMRIMDERSSSDDGNSLADDDKGQGPRDMVEFDDQNNKHADEISPIESDSDDLDGESLEGSNKFSSHSSESEDTTHSYSNSLLEDDGDDKNDNDDDSDEYYGVIQLQSDIQQFHTPDLSDFSNGNYKSMACSDSESPTEPLTQKIAAIFRRRFSSSNEPK